ncbi:hypothetical protein DBL67_21640 [Paenibacillus polymyxa]|nr:hypothetical protein DBL67_21640 [Paenibacillus polymyxa]
MPHLPKSDGKACSTAFLSQTTCSWGLPNLRSKQPAVLTSTHRLKKRSLEPAVRTNVKALLDEGLCEQAFIQRNALTSP